MTATTKPTDALKKPLAPLELIAYVCRFYSALETKSDLRFGLRACCNRTITTLADRDYRIKCRKVLRALNDAELRVFAGAESS